MHCMYRTHTALLSCQHSVDGIPAVEVLNISDGHTVTLHVDSPLKKSVCVCVKGGGGGKKNEF